MRVTSLIWWTGVWSTLILIPLRAPAQAVRPPVIERRARVTWTEGDRPRRETGAAAVAADMLRLRTTSGEIIPIAARHVVRLEVSTGRHRRWWLGGLVGMGIGAIVGALAGDASHRACQQEGGNACFFTSDRRSDDVLIGMGIWSVPGLVLGTAIGALVRADHWADSTVLVRSRL